MAVYGISITKKRHFENDRLSQTFYGFPIKPRTSWLNFRGSVVSSNCLSNDLKLTALISKLLGLKKGYSSRIAQIFFCTYLVIIMQTPYISNDNVFFLNAFPQVLQLNVLFPSWKIQYAHSDIVIRKACITFIIIDRLFSFMN